MPYVPVGEPRDVPGFQGFSAGSQAEEAALDEQYASSTCIWGREAPRDTAGEQYAQRTLTAQRERLGWDEEHQQTEPPPIREQLQQMEPRDREQSIFSSSLGMVHCGICFSR